MHPRIRTLTSAGLAALIAVSATTAFVSAESQASGPWLSGIKESDELEGPTLVEGLLLDNRGDPTSGRVMVVAWPPQEILGSLEVGDTVKTSAVGKATSDAHGRFALKVDPAVPLDEFMQPDGTINFDVWSETSDGWSLFSFPRKLVNKPRPAWVDTHALASDNAAEAPALSVRLRPDKSLGTPSEAEAPAPLSSKACTESVVATYNQRVGIVGEVYPGPNSTADFQYTSGSSSTLGVGFEASGGEVKWTASGTSGITSTSTIDYPTQPKNAKKVFQSTFQYKKFWAQCISGTSYIPVGHYMRPTAFQGGVSSYNAASAPTATNCSRIALPVTLTKETANAITFSNGLKIGVVIGIDLSLKTGFNTKTKIKHTFSSAGYLCGSNAAWPDAARIVGK